MVAAVKEGYAGFVIFLIQMKGVSSFRPNAGTDPLFAEALCQAAVQGVKVLAYDSVVTPGHTCIGTEIPVLL
jgi:sugar fermentation stimulation protein A